MYEGKKLIQLFSTINIFTFEIDPLFKIVTKSVLKNVWMRTTG